jgi:hypothetical protein
VAGACAGCIAAMMTGHVGIATNSRTRRMSCRTNGIGLAPVQS